MTVHPDPGADPLALARGLENLLRCDRTEAIGGMWRYFLAQRAVLGMAFRGVRALRSTPALSGLALLHGMRSFVGISASGAPGGAISVALRRNESRAIDELRTKLPDERWTTLSFGRRPSLSSLRALLATSAGCRRSYRVLSRIGTREAPFQALRAAELVFYYARYCQIFAAQSYRFAVVSTTANPHGIAFHLAARAHGVPIVLIGHSFPAKVMARLHYDLAILDSLEARRVFEGEGCRIGQSILKSRRREYRPLPSRRSEGARRALLVLSKAPNEEGLIRFLTFLTRHDSIDSISIRAHPANLAVGLPRRIQAAVGGPLGWSENLSFSQDLDSSDWVFAGNSAAHVEAVVAGKPSCYLAQLDDLPDDLYGFVGQGLVYPLGSDLDFDVGRILEFYQRPEWEEILNRYANVTEDEHEVAAQIRDAIARLGAAEAVA